MDFTGQRVGVIGTGASGIQAIPVIAEQAGQLTVFQRTAQFTIPAANGPLDQDFAAMWKQNYQEWRRRGRYSRGGIPYPASVTSALEVSEEERVAAFEGAWEQGGFMFSQGTFYDLVVNEEANKTAADFVRSKISEIVHDPAVAEMLKPRTFPFGTKRLPLDTNYYETFNRPNVTLVDLRAHADRGDHRDRDQDDRRRARPGRHRVRHRLRRADRAAVRARHPGPGRQGAGRRVGRGAARPTWACRSRTSRTCSPSPGRAARRC